MADDKARLPPTIFGLVPWDFVGVHSADGDSADFLVRLSSRFQVRAREQLPVYPVAGVRYVPVVLFERQHTERDEFGYRKLVPREENRFPRGAVADRQNHVSVGRAYIFRGGVVRHVRGLRLRRVALQLANRVLLFRDDLLFVGAELADEFAYCFPARRGTIRRHDSAIRVLVHANLLEPANDTGAISILAQAEPGVLSD